jgi:nitrogen permease regulator 2
MSVIKAIFFAHFHLAKGPHVLHQVPEGAIVKSQGTSDHDADPLFDFQAISRLIIPSQEFCDRLLTVCINHYRVISFPVCVENPKYERNEFIFNFALVLDESEDFSGYAAIVRKLAILFRNLEEQSEFLSKEAQKIDAYYAEPHSIIESDAQGQSDRQTLAQSTYSVGRKIYALCEMMFEDLNHYCECMIPIGMVYEIFSFYDDD